MSATHTAGPWIWHSPVRGNDIGDNGHILARLAPDRLEGRHAGKPHLDEDLVLRISGAARQRLSPANARLIAAAPALLETLWEILDVILIIFPDGGEAQVAIIYGKARRAIRNATEAKGCSDGKEPARR